MSPDARYTATSDARALIRLKAEVERDRSAASDRIEGMRQRRELLDGPADPVAAAYFALSIHGYYTAIETLCERVARAFDGGAPTDERSHQDLLEAMGLDLPAIRPAVLSGASLERLRELLGFRHFVRHAYAVTWRADRLRDLVDLALFGHGELHNELDVFVAFLDTLIAS